MLVWSSRVNTDYLEMGYHSQGPFFIQQSQVELSKALENSDMVFLGTSVNELVLVEVYLTLQKQH